MDYMYLLCGSPVVRYFLFLAGVMFVTLVLPRILWGMRRYW